MVIAQGSRTSGFSLRALIGIRACMPHHVPVSSSSGFRQSLRGNSQGALADLRLFIRRATGLLPHDMTKDGLDGQDTSGLSTVRALLTIWGMR